MDELRLGILVISDRASRKEYEDKSGPEIQSYIVSKFTNTVHHDYIIVPDEYSAIKRAMITLCDKQNCSLVLSSGGTGPAPRDITPEVTAKVVSRILPGFGELMRSESLKYVPTSILSRQTAGIRGKSLIINLPGSPKAIKQCLDAVIRAIPDCLKLIGGPTVVLKNDSTPIYHT